MKLLQIQPEERGKVFLCWLMLAIRPLGKVIGWSAVQVILIKRLGLESLPYSFVLFAIVSILGSMVYLFFADAIKRDVLLKVYCSVTGLALIGSVLFAHFYGISKDSMDLGFIFFAVFVLTASSLGDQTIGMQIWTIINDTFRPSQGVRLYPIIATAPLLGDILGGLALGFLIKRLPAENLLLFWGFAVLALVPMVGLFHRLYLRKEVPPKIKKTLPAFWQNLKDGYRFSFRFPLVYAIASICILFWTVASLKEFQYGKIINAHLLTEAQLGKYYSDYNVYLNTTVLFFQLALTGRFVKFLGVGYGFYALPITILLGLGSLWISPSFFNAICMRFSWDIIGLTIQGSSYQLAFHAVLASYRGRVRGLVEGLMNPVGGILGGCLLIFAPKPSLPYLAVLFSILWLFAAVVARKSYYKAIFKNLKSKDRNTYLDALEILNQTEKQMLKEIKKELGEKSDPILEQDYRTKRSKKTLFTALGKLKLYSLEQTVCYRLDLFTPEGDWRIQKKDNVLVVKKNQKTIRIFTLLEPGIAYWSNEKGYLAFFWNKKGIIWAEAGNYPASRILAVQCKQADKACQGVVKIQGEYAKPFSRFLLQIEPLAFSLGS